MPEPVLFKVLKIEKDVSVEKRTGGENGRQGN